jgi:hypothetical protein
MAAGDGVTYVPVNLNFGRAGTFHKSYAFYFREKPPDDAVITPGLSSALWAPLFRF